MWSPASTVWTDRVAAAASPALREAVARAEAGFDGECRRLHYLSVPPSAALPAVRLLGEAGVHPGERLLQIDVVFEVEHRGRKVRLLALGFHRRHGLVLYLIQLTPENDVRVFQNRLAERQHIQRIRRRARLQQS